MKSRWLRWLTKPKLGGSLRSGQGQMDAGCVDAKQSRRSWRRRTSVRTRSMQCLRDIYSRRGVFAIATPATTANTAAAATTST